MHLELKSRAMLDLGVIVKPQRSCLGWLIARAASLCLLAAISASNHAEEPTSQQVWTNYILAFPRNEKLYYEMDIETAHQVSGGEPWHYYYGTGMVEYYPAKLVDLTAELVSGYTNQKEEEDSFEVSTRLGIRIRFLKPLIDYYNKSERLPAKRISIANFTRIEQRNFWYQSDRPSLHDWRFRNRLEFRVALNKPNFSRDGLWYLMADWELFLPLGEAQVEERFATKFRVRAGGGYRYSYRWRFELLLQRDDARDTFDEDFEVEAYMVDLRVKMSF
jgi:hypothetical protein